MNKEIKELLFLLHNDRLTESGKKKLEKYITNLQEKYENSEKEYFRLMLESEEFYNSSKDYKSRIDKVIKYINDETKKIKSHQYATGIRRINKIKNMLQGSDLD